MLKKTLVLLVIMTTASLALTQKTFMLDPENPQFTFLENKFKDNSTIINFNNSGVKTKYIMLPKGAKITEASIALIGQAVQMKEENDISSNWYSPSDGPGGYYSTLFQMITINQTQIIDSIQIYVSGSYSGNRYQKFTVLKDWDRSNSQIPPSNNILASCEIDVYYSGWTPIGSCTNLNLTVQSGGYWIMHDGARSDRLYWKYSTDTYTGGMVGYYFFYFNQIQGMHLAFGTNSNNDMLIKVHGRAFPDNLRLSNEDNKTEFASTRLFNTNETLSLNISNIEEIINSCGTDECDVPINFEAGGVGGLTHTPNITFNMTLISSNVYQWENTDSLALNQSIKKTQTIGVYNYGVDTVLKKIKIPNSTATCIIDGQIQNVSNGECTIPQTTIQKGQIKQFTIWHDVLGKYNPLTSVIAARQQDPAKLTVPNEMSYSRQKITLINNETAYGMNGTTFTNINTETCIDSFTCLNDTLMSLGPNETKEWYVYFNKTAVWMNESIYQDPTRQTEINGTAYYLQEANLTNTDDIDYTINYNKSCIDSWGCDNNSLDLTLQPNSTLQHKILNTLENALFYKIDRREQDHSKETKLNSKAFTKRLVSIINSAALPFKNISWRVSADDGWNASIQNGTLDFNANSNVTFYIEQEHDSILTANYSDWVFTKTTFDEQALEQTITYQNNDNDLNYTIFDDNECYSTLDCTKIGNVTLQPGTTTKMLNVTSDLIDEKFEWRQDTQENSSIFKAHIQLNATINNMHPQNITNIALPITNRDMWNCSSLGTIDLEANTTHKPTHLVKCESQILQTEKQQRVQDHTKNTTLNGKTYTITPVKITNLDNLTLQNVYWAFNNTWNSTPHSGIINITNETLLYLFEENESILTADYSEWEQTNITFENQILTQKITYQNNDKELNFTVLDNNDCYSTMNCSRIGNITITPGETTMEINSSGDLIYESFEWQQDYNRGSSINNIYIRLKAAITNNLDKDITNIALPITDRPEWNCTTQGTLNLTKNSTQNFSNTVDCNAQALNTIINDREQDQTMETKINGKAFTKKKISITNPDTLMYTNVSWELPADENWTPTFNTGTINITSNETIELYLEQEQDSLLTANYSGWEFSKLGFDQQILTKIIEYNNRDIMLNYTVQESVPCYMNMSCQNISGNITLAPGLSISEINSTGDMIEEKFEWIQDKQQNSSIFKAFIRLDANITNNLNKNITGITLPITNRTLWNCSSLGTIDLEANTTHKPTHLVKCESQILQTEKQQRVQDHTKNTALNGKAYTITPVKITNLDNLTLQNVYWAFNNTWNSTPHSGVINITNETLLYLFEENESILTADYSNWKQTDIRFDKQTLTQTIVYKNNDNELNFTVNDNNKCYSTMNCSTIGNITLTPGERTIEINSSGDHITESFEWGQDQAKNSSVFMAFIKLNATIRNYLDQNVEGILLPITNRSKWNCSSAGAIDLQANSTATPDHLVDCEAQILAVEKQQRKQDPSRNTSVNGKAYTITPITISNLDNISLQNIFWSVNATETWNATENKGYINITTEETVYLQEEKDSVIMLNESGWGLRNATINAQTIENILTIVNTDSIGYTNMSHETCFDNATCASANITVLGNEVLKHTILIKKDFLTKGYSWESEPGKTSNASGTLYIRPIINIENGLPFNLTDITLGNVTRDAWTCTSDPTTNNITSGNNSFITGTVCEKQSDLFISEPYDIRVDSSKVNSIKLSDDYVYVTGFVRIESSESDIDFMNLTYDFYDAGIDDTYINPINTSFTGTVIISPKYRVPISIKSQGQKGLFNYSDQLVIDVNTSYNRTIQGLKIAIIKPSESFTMYKCKDPSTCRSDVQGHWEQISTSTSQNEIYATIDVTGSNRLLFSYHVPAPVVQSAQPQISVRGGILAPLPVAKKTENTSRENSTDQNSTLRKIDETFKPKENGNAKTDVQDTSSEAVVPESTAPQSTGQTASSSGGAGKNQAPQGIPFVPREQEEQASNAISEMVQVIGMSIGSALQSIVLSLQSFFKFLENRP